MTYALVRHPNTPSRAVEAIDVDLSRNGGLTALSYRVRGDIARLLVPAPDMPERTDGLWKATCFEAFVRPVGGEGYLELNFAPSGRWAAYAFDAYRSGMRDFQLPPPMIETAAGDSLYELRAAVSELPPGAWMLALSVVIEEVDGMKSYWALRHAVGKPDFHHAESFTAEERA